MSKLDIMTPSRSQTVIDGLYRDVERRIASSPPGLCPVDLALAFSGCAMRRPAASAYPAA